MSWAGLWEVLLRPLLFALALAAVLAVYDLLAPRPSPCEGCVCPHAGCLQECGARQRWLRIVGRQERFRRRWRR